MKVPTYLGTPVYHKQIWLQDFKQIVKHDTCYHLAILMGCEVVGRMTVLEGNAKRHKRKNHYSSVDLPAPSILPPQVHVPNAPSTPLPFIVNFVLSMHCEQNKNKQKESRYRHFLKKEAKTACVIFRHLLSVHENIHYLLASLLLLINAALHKVCAL